MHKPKAKKSEAMKLLEKLSGGPLTFARAIASVRKCDELSQDECARKLGISKSSLNRIEIGQQNVSLRLLERLCARLKCDVADLFADKSAVV